MTVAPRRAGPAAISRRAVVSARSRPPREHLLALAPRARRRGARRLPRQTLTLGAVRPSRRRSATADGERRDVRARWVVDASGRSGLFKRQARSDARPVTPRRQRLLVPRPGARQRGRLVERSGWQARVPSRPALAQHQSSDGPRLLGLADSARLGQHQHRHRRRRRLHPLLAHQPLRARDRLAARVRAAVRRGRRAASRTSSRTSSRCSTTRTAARGCSRRTAGRSSAKPASSPIRSIRPGRTSSRWATTTRPTRSCASRRRGRQRPRRVLQHDLPAPVRRVPPALRRPVPHDGQRAGDDGEGGLGQRLLLGDHRPALLPAPLPRRRVHRSRSSR